MNVNTLFEKLFTSEINLGPNVKLGTNHRPLHQNECTLLWNH